MNDAQLEALDQVRQFLHVKDVKGQDMLFDFENRVDRLSGFVLVIAPP